MRKKGRFYSGLETFMGVDQRTGEGSKPRIFRVVSKSDRDHGTATTAHRTLGLTPAGTMSRSNLSLSLYPIPPPRRISLQVRLGGPNKSLRRPGWETGHWLWGGVLQMIE